jgi:hypothetical protein
MSKDISVVFSKTGWIVKEEGRILSTHNTRQVAFERASRIARKRNAQVRVLCRGRA